MDYEALGERTVPASQDSAWAAWMMELFPPGSIAAAKIADGAITTARIADNALCWDEKTKRFTVNHNMPDPCPGGPEGINLEDAE